MKGLVRERQDDTSWSINLGSFLAPSMAVSGITLAIGVAQMAPKPISTLVELDHRHSSTGRALQDHLGCRAAFVASLPHPVLTSPHRRGVWKRHETGLVLQTLEP